MPKSSRRRTRSRGSVERLASGALRVRVYGGTDPVTKRELVLRETVPAGPNAAREAERVKTRLLNRVDEKRHARTDATMRQLIEKWLAVLDADPTTRRSYESKINKHILPLLGDVKLTVLAERGAEVLDSFYAECRRCREHCDGKRFVQHRTRTAHRCDEHAEGTQCSPPDAKNCKACRRRCRDHVCVGLADSTVRQVHWIISGALDRAVAWRWLAINPADHASKPSVPTPNPRPPSAEEAARLVEVAYSTDPWWGALVWTLMTTGMRRGEICALRWTDLDLSQLVVSVSRSIYIHPETGDLVEKDTKTHQQRRIVLDEASAAVLIEHRRAAEDIATGWGYAFPADGYVFSPAPDGKRPLNPDTAGQRFQRMAERLGLRTTIKSLRSYNATELITAGVDPRTVGGRLGHSGGGTTTLRVYAAWSSEADQRAAAAVSARMPSWPGAKTELAAGNELGTEPPAETGPYMRIANDLRAAITCGALSAGAYLPAEKDLATRYGVARSTAHRAIAILADEGLITVSRGRRATVK